MNLLTPLATGAALLAPLARQSLQVMGQTLGDFRALLESDSPEGATAAGSSDVESTDEALATFHERLLEQLSALGLELDEPIEISQSALGGLTVVSAHPQLMDIERVLADDTTYLELYREIAAARAEASGSARQLDIVWNRTGATTRLR